jgi:hypothetical protein
VFEIFCRDCQKTVGPVCATTREELSTVNFDAMADDGFGPAAIAAMERAIREHEGHRTKVREVVSV